MGKMRDVRHQHPTYGVESSGRITVRGDQGGGSNKNKFAVFEFAEDDERIEVDSCRVLSKFENKTPSRKHAHHHPVDKYDFLSFFTEGIMASRHNLGTKPSIVDVSNVSILRGSSNCRLQPFCSQNHRDSEFFGEEKFCGYGKGTGKKHNKALCGNSNDGEVMEMKSTSFDLAVNGGSVEELSSENDTNVNDCEAMVAVAPKYVKYRSKSYTKCHLTFSQRCVSLEGSSLCKDKSHHCLEWSINDIMKIEYQPHESMEADFVNLQFKSRDANVSGACNLNSDADIVELEFVVLGDSQWSKRLEEIKSLDPKYEAAWKTITHVYSSDMAFEDIIYPKGDPDAVFISKKDVDLLQPRTFINDTIIDFYIKYLLNRVKSVGQHRFHAFNTFFFRKLAGLDQYLYRAWDGKKTFQRVWKWTRNVNLFEQDYILIPVNFSSHWSLIVICHPGKVANIEEIDMDNSSEMPCILHMDSLQGSHSGFENLIQSYLWEEWKERHNEWEADVSVKFLNLPFVALQLPQQENFFDCGIFLLHYAEQFLQLVTNFSTRKYDDLLNKDLFLPAEVSLKKRDHIRNLIYRIAGDDVGEDPPAVRNDICLPGDNANKGDDSVEFVKETNVRDMSEPSHIAKSVSNELSHLCEPLVSIKETPHEKLTTFRPAFSTSSTSVAPIIIDVQNGEDCVLEVKSTTDNEKNESGCSSPSSEVLAACVADSEEENETQSISRKHWCSAMRHL